MSNALQIFNHAEFGEVRTVKHEGNWWFVAKDICDVLGIKNISQAVQQLDEDERSMFNIGRQGETNIINESGLYSLILRSRKPEAKKFKRWVTSEVLPTLRRTGTYVMPHQGASQPYQPTEYDWEKLRIEKQKLNIEKAAFVKDFLSEYSTKLPPESLQVFSVKCLEAALGEELSAYLPNVTEATYSATAIGDMFGKHRNTIGRTAIQNGLKTKDYEENTTYEYGTWKWTKAANNNKEVPQFLYNEKAVEWFRNYFSKP